MNEPMKCLLLPVLGGSKVYNDSVLFFDNQDKLSQE